MVIILQQTLEDGQRFVSTVVGNGEASFTSSNNFSINSQHSISERSAVYKQRIDSLFGRPPRLTPFAPNGDGPFKVRIQSGSPPKEEEEEDTGDDENEEDDDDDDDEDSYSRITDKSSSSVVTDSLNHRALRKKHGTISHSNNNVSSIRITCDTEETLLSVSPQPQSIIISNSSPSPGSIVSIQQQQDDEEIVVNRNNNICSISIPASPTASSSSAKGNNSTMWRNGTYGECPNNNNNSNSNNNNSNSNGEEKSFGFVRSGPGGMLQFSVEYLGSVPVDGTTTSLQDLQTPLKNLYKDFLSRKNVMNGQLAITSDGIRFEAPKLRLVNPFSTIAVWAAIKFVARGEEGMECAFMPLISDPEGQDKSRLFGAMDPELSQIYLACSKPGFKNPPLFACVMREATFSLDCHAFACKCAEDAIVVAANLYQSLVDKMRSGSGSGGISKEGESGYGSLNRSPSGMQSSPNQNRSSSSASSSGVGNEGQGSSSQSHSGPSSSSGIEEMKVEVEEHTSSCHRVVFSDSESLAPVRPPRRKKKNYEIPPGNLKRYNSEDSVLLRMPNRRKSFNKRNQQVNKIKKRVQISTPDESSSADSINESIDQVLDRIINPGGMSFNDLKPSYQDLILKIALTLTQDQLYQKSKQAMKKQQLYLRKKSKNFGSSDEENSQFLNQLMKSFSKITSSSKSTSPKRLGGAVNKGSSGGAGCSRLLNKPNLNQQILLPPPPRKVILKKPNKDEDAFMSFCSGCVCDNCSDKCYCSLPSKQILKNGGKPPPCPLGKGCLDKDKPRKLCGYDSESCAESEKCYCSLQRVKSNGLKIYNINLDTETSDTDTNSYDLEPFNQQPESSSSSNGKTVSARSVEILSYHPAKRLAYSLSPGGGVNGATNLQHIQTTNAMVHFEESLNIQSSINTQCSPNSGGNKSLPSYYNNGSNGHKSDCSRDKVLLITGASPVGRVAYRKAEPQGNHNNDGKKSRNGMHRNLLDIIEDECNEDEEGLDSEGDGLAPEKVLSMKKTAEIAAMFTDLKLDQTTNIVQDLGSGNFESIQNTEDSTASLDFEASLGYLP